MLHAVLNESFSWTIWCWEWIKRIFQLNPLTLENPLLKWEWVIKNLTQLKEQVNQRNKIWWSKSHRTNWLIEKLYTLKENLSLEIDPILYLIHLYYEEQLSIEDIFRRVNWKWLNYEEPSWLRKLFTNTFKWNLRENTESTPSSKRKKRNNTSITNASKVLEEQKRIRFLEWLIKYSFEEDNPQFDKSYYDSLNNKALKIRYLLFSFYNIWDKEIKIIKEYWIWARTLVRYLQSMIDDICEKNNLDKIILDTWTLWRIVKAIN